MHTCTQTDGYSTEDVIFQWAPEDPVQIAEDTELPQFNLMDTKTSICTKVYSTGKHHFDSSCTNLYV